MAIYMKYGSINGAVTTKGYEKWIELISFRWGTGRGIGTAARGAQTRESSEPTISEVTVQKAMDASSPNMFVEAVAGQLNATVKISFTTTTKNTITEYLQYELTNTGLSGYSVSSSGDLPTEVLTLNFTKVQITYKGTDPSISSTPNTVGYDMTTMSTT
jgi:type VI secretion system secreted protein Hcp